MKKFFAGIAAAAIITVPMTSFALESMSKGALKKATGQAGVSIGLDNIVIYMSSQPTTTYWDNDGTSTGYSLEAVHNSGATSLNNGSYSNIGTIERAGIQISYDTNAQKLITIGAILDGSVYGAAKMKETFGVSAGIADGSTNTLVDVTNGNSVKSLDNAAGYVTKNNQFVGGISPLTIDVGTCQALTQGLAYNKLVNKYQKEIVPAINLGTDKVVAKTEYAAYATAQGELDAMNALNNDDDDTNNVAQGVIDAKISEVGTKKTAWDTAVAAATPAARATARGYVVGNLDATVAPIVDAMENNASATELTAGLMASNANIVGVVIGLPTVEIKTYHTDDIQHIKAVVDTKDLKDSANANCEFISIEKSGNRTMAILGGRLEIAPH